MATVSNPALQTQQVTLAANLSPNADSFLDVRSASVYKRLLRSLKTPVRGLRHKLIASVTLCQSSRMLALQTNNPDS